MDIYVATRSDRPDLLVVGSSDNASISCELMQRGYCLTVEPVVIFCGAGKSDRVVYKALEQWKIFGGWYEMTLDDACRVICRTLSRVGRPTQSDPTPVLEFRHGVCSGTLATVSLH
jgi:hypothetical protein